MNLMKWTQLGTKTARLYANFNVHNPHQEGKAAPPRPIVDGNNSLTEHMGVYPEHHIKELSTKHDTHLKDTPDFLRCLN